jgi:hypothetical protein
MKKLFFISIFLLLLQLKTYELQTDKKDPIEKYYELLEFSKQNLYGYIKLLGFKDPFFIYKQAINESGWFKAPLFKSTNNLFGLHKAYKRETTADYWIYADHGIYSGYNHWTKSVQDRKLYENWLLKTYPNTEYKLALMQAGYCQNRQYIRNVESIKVDMKRL